MSNFVRNFNRLSAIFLCSMLILPSASASSEGEREALTRLLHEIQALEPIIQEAQAQADPEDRVRFEYLWLRRDLTKIAQGLQDHINGPRNEPRKFEPLRGDYRR